MKTDRALMFRFSGAFSFLRRALFPTLAVAPAKRLRLAATVFVVFSLLSPACSVLVTAPLSTRGSLEKLMPAFSPCFGVALAQEYPQPVGFVNDFADVVPVDIRAKIEAIALELKQKTGSEIVVVTVRTTDGVDIHDYSVELFTRWGIGKKGQDNGLLIIAAIEDRKVWIKTGYGLEETIPDAVASRVYRDVLRPSFKEGAYGRGLLSAVQVLAGRIANHAGVQLTSLDKVPVGSGGDAYRSSGRPFVPFALIGGVMILLIFLRIIGGPRSGRYGGFPFWTVGGFSGGMKGGGFGGGFGGFGGGSCGGGGAGGGW